MVGVGFLECEFNLYLLFCLQSPFDECFSVKLPSGGPVACSCNGACMWMSVFRAYIVLRSHRTFVFTTRTGTAMTTLRRPASSTFSTVTSVTTTAMRHE